MRKKKLLILVVSVSVVLSGIFIISNLPKDKGNYFYRQKEDKLPLLEVREVEITGWEEGGEKSWILEAEEGLQFFNKVVLEKARAILFEEGKPVSEGKADKVIIESSAPNFYLEGNVSIISYNNEAILETSLLKWNDADKRLYTEKEVTITKGDLVIHGIGLIGKPDLSLIIIKNQVTTYYKGGN